MHKRALISVSDKCGIVGLAQAFVRAGIEVVSTGGTLKQLVSAGVPATSISDVTGFPEILDGRVKTLHPAVHAGLLARRDNSAHMSALDENGLSTIDYVVVNLYPFSETIADPKVVLDDAIEQIDIGGPSMLRSAAKNWKDVVVVSDVVDYKRVITTLDAGKEFSDDVRLAFAAKTFRHTAAYDAIIAQYLSAEVGEVFPEQLTVTYNKVQDLRYGENPHQAAAFYAEGGELSEATSLVAANKLHGKDMSYNNINDADAAIAVVSEFAGPAVVAVKHTNPCGVGLGVSIADAYQRAFESDPISIFGGIIACNREVDVATAERMSELFLEVIIAPGFAVDASDILMQKPSLRLLKMPSLDGVSARTQRHVTTDVRGGLLVQDRDAELESGEPMNVVTDRAPTEEELDQLRFAWSVVKHVKSNAIVLATDDGTVGVGAGQTNRVGAARIAIEQAGLRARGSVMASDAFFPMPDTIEIAAEAGITAIVQPGGSIRDSDCIEAANKFGIAMVCTGVRHFKH